MNTTDLLTAGNLKSVENRRYTGVTAAGMLLIGLLVACSSNSGGGTTSAAGGTTSAGSDPVDIASAQEFVAKYEMTPTSFNLPPLKSAPEKGKRIALVYSNTGNEQSEMAGAQEAAALIGWTTVPIVYDPSTPTGLIDAFAQAADIEPDGVVTAGTDATTYAVAAQRFVDNNIPVVTSSTADEVIPPILANVANAEQTALVGRMTANYVIAQKGADANVALFNAPSFVILDTYEKAFEAEYHRLCPTCAYKAVSVQFTDVGTKMPQQIVSELQNDPKINYIVFGTGDLTAGVPAALSVAGISGVKIIGEAPGLANMNNLINGTEDMWIGYPLYGISYKSIDALARYFNGEETSVSTTADTPFQIFTQSNAPNPAELPEVPGYQDYFKSLWQVTT